MIKLKSKNAFSLIELSIVILIIGILVAGVTQSSRLVSRIKIFTAQSITISSEISSIANLTLWLETSLDKSLTNSALSFEVEDNNLLQSWNDINPQTTAKLNITQNTPSLQPIYKLNGINGLPSVSFNGASQQFNNMSFVPLMPRDKDFTLILVWNANTVTKADGQIIYSQNSNTCGGSLLASVYIYNSAYGYAGDWNDYRPVAVNPLNNYISIVTMNSNLATNNVSIYTNSNTPSTGTSDGGPANLNIGNGNFVVGGKYCNGSFHQYYNGIISEIIIFDRVLKADEIKSVNSYLSKKYSIKIS